MTVLYPAGYGRSLITLAQLKTFARADLMEPEYRQRLFAWIVSRQGHVGIGGAWRTTQPTLPGFAPDGKSFHQTQTFSSGFKGFMAVDLVCRNGSNIHRAPRWDEVPAQGSSHPDIRNYGVHCNVSGEPWHMQAIEVDGWQTWVDNGRRHPNPNFPIIGQPAPAPQPKPPTTDIKPGDRTLRLTSPTMKGPDVLWLQVVLRSQGLNVSVDSIYGRQTRDRVKIMQGWNNLTQDGVVGPKTWAALKAYVE